MNGCVISIHFGLALARQSFNRVSKSFDLAITQMRYISENLSKSLANERKTGKLRVILYFYYYLKKKIKKMMVLIAFLRMSLCKMFIQKILSVQKNSL